MPSISVSRPTALALVGVVLALLVLVGNRLAGAGTAHEPEVVAPLEPCPPRRRSTSSCTSWARCVTRACIGCATDRASPTP